MGHEAWATLHSDTWRPFATPTCRSIAVKVLNHPDAEAMTVFSVGGASRAALAIAGVLLGGRRWRPLVC